MREAEDRNDELRGIGGLYEPFGMIATSLVGMNRFLHRRCRAAEEEAHHPDSVPIYLRSKDVGQTSQSVLAG